VLPDTPVGLWRDTGQHLVTFNGTLAEWSLDALGWLAAFLAQIAFVHGVNRPLDAHGRPQRGITGPREVPGTCG